MVDFPLPCDFFGGIIPRALVAKPIFLLGNAEFSFQAAMQQDTSWSHDLVVMKEVFVWSMNQI